MREFFGRCSLLGIALVLSASACVEDESLVPVYEGPPIPWSYRAFPEVVHPADNPSSDAKVALGRLLFYDPILSRDQKVACATCHSEVWGLGDGLALSIGVDGEGPAGPGRVGPTMTTRNAPSLWNVAFRTELFWDGRFTSLEDQGLAPIANEVELDIDPEEVVRLLGEIPEYRERFDDAFSNDEEPLSTLNLARALSAFQRSFVSNRAPYDLYVAGDEGALDEESVRGMNLFAEAGCANCHAPPLFSSDVYAVRVDGTEDEGRSNVTSRAEDTYAFRVPSLRNARETSPFFHDGRVVTLEEAIKAEVATSTEREESRPLSEDEVADLVAFIKKALMDRSREPTRPDGVPSGLPVPVDGLRVPR